MPLAMTPKLKIAVLGSLAVVTFDAAASLASRVLNFPYTSASIGSYIIYAAVGFLAWRIGGFRLAALTGAVLGLVDASAGWAVSEVLKANAPPTQELTPMLWVIIAITVMITATICSLSGAVVARLLRRPAAPAS